MHNKFQQYIRQNPILIGIFIIFQTIFVILLIFVINKFVNTNTFKESSLPISSLKQDLQDLPENSIETIQTALYNIVAANKGTISNIENSDAKVRDGTMVNLYFEKQNMHYINFIVDIPSIQQSYQIFNEWSDDPVNQYYMTNRVTMAMCLHKEQMIYQNFDCRDDYSHNGQAFIASNFLYYLVDINYFRVYLQPEDAPYVVIIGPTTFNVDAASKPIYIEQTKEKIASLGLPPDAFSYYVASGPQDLRYYLESVVLEGNQL